MMYNCHFKKDKYRFNRCNITKMTAVDKQNLTKFLILRETRNQTVIFDQVERAWN